MFLLLFSGAENCPAIGMKNWGITEQAPMSREAPQSIHTFCATAITIAIKAAMGLGHAGKAVQIGAVARRRQHQRAATRDLGAVSLPPVGGVLTQTQDDGFGAFRLAPRGQHPAGPPAAGMGAGLAGRVDDAWPEPARHQFGRNAQAHDACTKDSCLGHFCPHILWK